MISNVNSTTNPTATATAMQSSLALSSDDFLKLFVAQLQNQDPTQPQDPSTMLNQLSQMTLVQQGSESNTALNNLLTAQNNALSMSSLSLVGKNIVANGNSISFDGSDAASLQFNLPSSASAAAISISDASGNAVKTASLGAQAAGNVSYTWDGTNNNGTLLPAGAYTYAVTATSSSGAAVTATPYTTGIVTGVDLTGSTPSLTVGSMSVPITNIINVQGG